MSERSVKLLLEDIIDSAHKIITYTKGLSYDDFAADPKTIDAVIRNFEIIGEAANRLPDDYRYAHDNIDWQRIRGLRNRIAHHYFGIDNKIIWNIIQSFLPDMIQDVTILLQS